jgi:hypothetical protein
MGAGPRPAGAALAFGLVGAVYFTWAARLPAVKADLGLSDVQLAVALVGLEVGALVGLQIGGVLVPRTGSRAALTVSLPLLAALLVGPGLAASLPVLTAAAFVLAAAVNVATVAMNAYGVAVQQRYGRPILSGLYAMHSLGGIAGAGVAALAAALGVGRAGHFLTVALGAALLGVGAGRLLLPTAASSAAGPGPAGASGAQGVLGGWLAAGQARCCCSAGWPSASSWPRAAAVCGAPSGCVTAWTPAPARPRPAWRSSWPAPPPAGWSATGSRPTSARPGCSGPGGWSPEPASVAPPSRRAVRPGAKAMSLPCHPTLCRMRLDHPDDHPDDRSGAVWSRLDRRGIQCGQARSVCSHLVRRRASVSQSEGRRFESVLAS